MEKVVTTAANGGGRKHDEENRKISREERQKDGKMEEQIEKLINSLVNSTTNPDKDKLTTLARNFIILEREHHKQNTSIKQNEKQFEVVLREKELLQKEYNKGVLIRDKLEQVCREQQKLMKSIKSESMTKIREEEEKRKEIQARFQQSINEIFATLSKNNEENTKLKEANSEMTKKFKYLAEQYELREKQLEKIHEQINLETQLNEAKLTKIKMETTIEREILLKEKAAVLEDLLSTKKTIVDMQKREKILKDQLSLYTNKYEDFQSSLKKSNDIFTTYKSEIEKMTKKTKSLEKECYEWRVKFEKSNRAVLEMATDKQAQDQYVGKAARQLAQLQKLCRTLQMERNSLIDVLKSNNIERPPMPELPPEPTDIEPPPQSADKLDIMSRNCSDLKKTLAQLQGQMNALTAEKAKNSTTIPTTTTTTTAATADESAPLSGPTNKKNKNKKSKLKSCPTKEKNQIQTNSTSINSETDKNNTKKLKMANEVESLVECGKDLTESEPPNESNIVTNVTELNGSNQSDELVNQENSIEQQINGSKTEDDAINNQTENDTHTENNEINADENGIENNIDLPLLVDIELENVQSIATAISPTINEVTANVQTVQVTSI